MFRLLSVSEAAWILSDTQGNGGVKLKGSEISSEPSPCVTLVDISILIGVRKNYALWHQIRWEMRTHLPAACE